MCLRPTTGIQTRQWQWKELRKLENMYPENLKFFQDWKIVKMLLECLIFTTPEAKMEKQLKIWCLSSVKKIWKKSFKRQKRELPNWKNFPNLTFRIPKMGEESLLKISKTIWSKYWQEWLLYINKKFVIEILSLKIFSWMKKGL